MGLQRRVGQQCRLIGQIAALVGVFLFVSFLKYQLLDTHFDQPLTFPQGEQSVTNFSPEVDDDWLPVMRHGDIVSCVPFNTFDAYADKFIAHFADGRRVMLKLMERRSLFDRALRTFSWDSERNHESKRAESGGYQAMPELIAWHVDRVLGFYRKPPITSRIVSSKLLYPTFLTSLLPGYDVPVSVHAWVEGLHKIEPSTTAMNYLNAEHILMSPNDEIKNYILQVSDILVLDYLVDDHDRQAEKNWIGRDDFLVSWDNGLGWNHGPFGEPSCLDILCGSNRWRRSQGLNRPCRRICVFRESTVKLLRSLGPGAGETDKLSYRLREALRTHEAHLYPLFHFGVYFRDGSFNEIVQYDSESFFDGMDGRVQALLLHIDSCVARHGREIAMQH